ncbi:hypothetical protein MPER_04609, partial [Moniliophthora perniciosa FA553]
MSARHAQNKKLRNAKRQRERTVTELTGDSDSLFNSNHHHHHHHHPLDDDQTMSHGPPHTFLAPAFYTNFMNQSQAATYPTAPQTAPAAMIPGSNDLEKLENLKNIIKSGQHQLFTTEPKPDALAALYLGQIPHSEQETMLEDSASRPPRLQGKEMTRKPLQNN